MMLCFFSRPHSRSSWAVLLGIMCIALVLMSGIIHVAHCHPSGQIEHDCSLCNTAHQAIQIVVLVTFNVSSQPVLQPLPEEAIELPRRRFIIFKLAIRPPPSSSDLA